MKIKTAKKEANFFSTRSSRRRGLKIKKGEVMSILNVINAWPFKKMSVGTRINKRKMLILLAKIKDYKHNNEDTLLLVSHYEDGV